MSAAPGEQTAALAHLASAARPARGAGLVFATMAAAAIGLIPLAVYFALSGRLPYRAILIALGEGPARRRVEAPEPSDARSSPALVPSLAGGGERA